MDSTARNRRGSGARSVAALLAFAVVACDANDGITIAVDDNPVGSNYAFVLSPDSLRIYAGSFDRSILTVTRLGGFAGQITFSPVDVPAGISVAIEPNAAVADSWVVTVNAGPTVLAGRTSISIRGSTPNRPDRIVALALVTQLPEYRLTLVPGTLLVQPALQGFTVLTLIRDPGFTQPVTLTAMGAPEGVGVTFPSTPSDTRVIGVAVSGAVAVGRYDITIRASTPNLPDRTVALTLIVQASMPGANTTVRFCGFRPIFFAFQDGDAHWGAVADSAGTYRFGIAAGRGAFAFVFRINYVGGDVAFETYAFYGTQAELNAFSAPCAPSALGSVSGVVANSGPDPKVAVGLNATRRVSPYSLSLAREPFDLVAWTTDIRGSLANRAIIRRDLRLAGGSVLPVLDFNSAEAFALVPYALTFPTDDAVYVSVDFRTKNGTVAPLMCYDFGYNFTFCSVSNYDFYPGVPAPVEGEVHQFSLGAQDRAITTCYRHAVAQSLSLPPRLGPVDVSAVATTPTPRFRAQYTRQPEYNGGVQITFSNPEPTFISRRIQLNVAPGYLGAISAVDITMPDFTGVGGFSSDWGLVQGSTPAFGFEAMGWTNAPGTNAAACGGESTPFDRNRPESSQIQTAWTSRPVQAAASSRTPGRERSIARLFR